MTLAMLLTGLASIGALVMLFQYRPLGFPALAAIVSGLEALSAFRIVHVSISRVPLPLVFGVALVVAGVAVYLKSATKSLVTAATVVALVGGLQAFLALR
jgi:hypothetical protein